LSSDFDFLNDIDGLRAKKICGTLSNPSRFLNDIGNLVCGVSHESFCVAYVVLRISWVLYVVWVEKKCKKKRINTKKNLTNPTFFWYVLVESAGFIENRGYRKNGNFDEIPLFRDFFRLFEKWDFTHTCKYCKFWFLAKT